MASFHYRIATQPSGETTPLNEAAHWAPYETVNSNNNPKLEKESAT